MKQSTNTHFTLCKVPIHQVRTTRHKQTGRMDKHENQCMLVPSSNIWDAVTVFDECLQ